MGELIHKGGAAGKIYLNADNPNQVVKIGTRNADFSPAKFAYDVVSRALTSDINSGKISLFGSSGNLLKPSYPGISINFGKSLARGIFSGFGKLLFS